MRENTTRPDPTEDHKPQRQTGEQQGSIKSAQLKRTPERADLARGSETETRAAGGRRG